MAMDKVIKHGLELSVGWDKDSQKRMQDAVRNVFTKEAHIDFANPENIQGLKVLGEMMRKIFTQAGDKKFDFEKIMGAKDASQMFAGLKEAAMEFDRVWESLIANMGSFSFKDMFMRDASELSSALQRITDKNGKIIKANIKDIQRAFEEITTSDQNKLFGNLLSAEKAIKGARTWEARTAAALEYVNIYEKIIKLTDGDVMALDVDKKYMKYAERSLSKNNKVAEIYSVDALREAMPQMQTSLQNIFNMAMGKALVGLTDGGVIDVNVAPVVINKLDVGDLFEQKVGKGAIEVPVEFKTKLGLWRDLAKKKNKTAEEQTQFGDIEEEILRMFPDDQQEAVLDRLYEQFEQLQAVRGQSYVKLYKDFMSLGMQVGDGEGGFGLGGGFGTGTGIGTGDGTDSGDTPSEELTALQQQLTNKEAELARIREENAAKQSSLDSTSSQLAEAQAARLAAEKREAELNTEIEALRQKMAEVSAGNKSGFAPLFPDGTELEEKEVAMVTRYLDIMKKKLKENYKEAEHLRAALDLVFNIKNRNIEAIIGRFTNGNNASNAVLNMATNMPTNNQQNRDAALRSLDETEYDRIVAERNAILSEDKTEFQKKWEELASAMLGGDAFADENQLVKGKIAKAFESLGGTAKEGIDQVNKMWLAGELEGKEFKNKYIQSYVNHLNQEKEYYDDLRNAKSGDIDIDKFLSGDADVKLTEEKVQALKYLVSVYDELIAKKKEYYGIGAAKQQVGGNKDTGVSTRTEEDVENARKVAEYEAQARAEAETTEKADKRRSELLAQLDKYAVDTLDADTAQQNLNKREKIIQILREEQLATAEIERNYAATNNRLQTRNKLLSEAIKYIDDPVGTLKETHIYEYDNADDYYDNYVSKFDDVVDDAVNSGVFSEDEIEKFHTILDSMKATFGDIKVKDNYERLADLQEEAVQNVHDAEKLNDILRERDRILADTVWRDGVDQVDIEEQEKINSQIEERIKLLREAQKADVASDIPVTPSNDTEVGHNKDAAKSYEELKQKVEAFCKVRQQMVSLMEQNQPWQHLIADVNAAKEELANLFPATDDNPTAVLSSWVNNYLQETLDDQETILNKLSQDLGVKAPQAQADAAQRALELTKQRAEEEARITAAKQHQLELDKKAQAVDRLRDKLAKVKEYNDLTLSRSFIEEDGPLDSDGEKELERLSRVKELYEEITGKNAPFYIDDALYWTERLPEEVEGYKINVDPDETGRYPFDPHGDGEAAERANDLVEMTQGIAENFRMFLSKAYVDIPDEDELEEQIAVMSQDDTVVENNEKKIKSYEKLTAAVSRYIELAKSLVDTEKMTPEHQQIKNDMDIVGMMDLNSQDDYITAINEQQEKIKKIKAAIKIGAEQYKTDDGYTERITEDTLGHEEKLLRGYIYQYAENFDDIDTLLAEAKTKTLKNIITKEIDKFTVDADIQRQQEEIAEAANAAALAEMEQIEDLIEGSAPTEKFNKVFDTLGDLQHRAHQVDRYTQSSVTDDLADDIGITSPHKEIENNAKAIKSYEELCSVVERYNELIEKRYIYSGDQYPTLNAEEEDEFAELKGRLNATREGVKITYKEVEGDINKLAQLLGITVPQAAQQAQQAVDGLNNELKTTGDNADNIGEQLGPNSSADTGTGQTDGATTEEVQNLEAVREKVEAIKNEVKEKTQEFLNEKSVVKKASESEVHALGEVEKKVTAIRVALSNVNTLLKNIQKGNDISQLSDIKVTVNYPEQQNDYSELAQAIKTSLTTPNDDKQDKTENQWEKNVTTLLTRIKLHTHNTVRQIRDNLINKLESQFGNLKNNVYNVKIAHDDNDKQANKVAIDAEELEGVLRRVLTKTSGDGDSADMADSNVKAQIDGLVAQYKRAMATIEEWQMLYQNLNSLPSTNKPAEQRKNVLEAVNGISPELAHMIGGTFEEAFKVGFKGVKTKDIARHISRIAEESLFGSVPEQVEMLQKLNVDKFDFDKLPIQKASIVELDPVFELLKQIDAIQKGEVNIESDDRDGEAPTPKNEAYALDSTLKEVKGILERIAANTASLNGVEIQRAVEKNTVATEGVAPAVAKETSAAVAEGTNGIAKVIEKKRADDEGNINSEYANSRTVVRGQKTSDSYQTVKTHMVPQFDEDTKDFLGYKTALVEIIDDFDKIRKENLKAEKDLVRAQKKVSEFLAKFQSKTGGNAQYVKGFSDLQNMAEGIDASNIDIAYNKMIELQQQYAELERNFRKGQSSLNPFVNAINRSENIGNIFGDVQDKFDGLIEKSKVLTTKFAELEELAKKIQGFTQTMQTNPDSIAPKDFTEFSQWMGDFTALKTQVDAMIRSEKAVEKETAAKNAERAKEIKSLAAEYEKLGKLRAKFEGSRNLETKEELKILAEQVKKRRESLKLTTDEVVALREKSAEAYKTEQRLIRAAKEQKLLAEQQKAAEKAAQDASKQTDKDTIKQAKKQAAEEKRQAKRNAMFGKAGNAIGRAENLWMSAQGEDNVLPRQLVTQVDALYKKMVALRKEQDKVRNAETVTKKQQNNLRNHTIEMNALTNEVSELFSEYQKLSGANVDETKTKTTALNSKSPLSAYESELKQYVKSIEGGKAQIKNFDAVTKTLTYTVKTGKNEFTEYTAAVRRADGALVSVRGATKRTETFIEATTRKMKELTSYMSGMAIFSRASQELRRGVQYVREIDLALTELKKVTDQTEEEYDQFLQTAAKTGARLGTTISAVTEATATFAKLGYTMEQATEMAESAIVYKNVGDNIESTADAADSIISTMKGFGLEASEAMAIVDRFNEVGE